MMNPTKCDVCDRPAVVHELTVKNGVSEEVHLCEEHALEAGVSLPSQQPINQLLTQFVITQAGKTRGAGKKACPTCGMTFGRFRQVGTLGCADCYQTFEKQLAPLIERAQNQATHHRGKTPQRAGTSIDEQLEAQRLVRELDEAVAAEQYERAAELRDQLRTVDPKRLDAAHGSKAQPDEG